MTNISLFEDQFGKRNSDDALRKKIKLTLGSLNLEMMTLYDRNGKELSFNPFEGSSKKMSDRVLAQPGAGQTQESRTDWLNRLADDPNMDTEVLSMVKEELFILDAPGISGMGVSTVNRQLSEKMEGMPSIEVVDQGQGYATTIDLNCRAVIEDSDS